MMVKRLALLVGLLVLAACETSQRAAVQGAAARTDKLQQAEAMSFMQWYRHAIADSRW